MDDDILARIDAILFPPDETLTDEAIDRILDREIDDDTDDDLEREAAVARDAERDHLDLVYGIERGEVIFVERSTADWIDAALPRVEAGELDWEDDIPWVQRDQEEVLPAAVVERFGTYERTALDGPVVTFRAADTEAIVEWLEQLGSTCTRDDELVCRVCFG